MRRISWFGKTSFDPMELSEINNIMAQSAGSEVFSSAISSRRSSASSKKAKVAQNNIGEVR